MLTSILERLLMCVVIFLTSVGLAWIIQWSGARTEGRYFNCSLPEGHPDVSPTLRDYCRKLNKQEIK